MATRLDSTDTDLATLNAVTLGAVHGPYDPGYSEACAAWNLAWTHRPAVVVHAASEADVVAAVAHARRHGLAVVVQATGHGVTVPADENSLLLVVTDLDTVRIDPEARTATIGGGVSWNPVLTAAAEHGLTPLVGSAPHVGAVGYSLGGGFGWLARKYGLSVDSIRSLRVVLADGRTVTASPIEENELFWALCGAGGGSLGVVVEMTVGLAPVDEVYAGNLYYPLEDAATVFTRYLEWARRSPVEMTTAFNITSFPPLDVVPEPVRGKTYVIVRGCHAGDRAVGARLMDEWRGWRRPLMDTWTPMPFVRCAEISQDPVDPVPATSSGRWLATADAGVVEVMLDAVTSSEGPTPMLFAEMRHAGGAIGRTNPAVSFAARNAEWSMELVGMVTGPDADTELERRFSETWNRLESRFAPLPGYLNFAEGHERITMARAAFGEQERARLARLKQQVDPAGTFSHGVALDGPGWR